MLPRRNLANSDFSSSTENSLDFCTIIDRIKIGKASTGVLYYEVQDIDNNSTLIQELQEYGFHLSIVTDLNIKELLPTPHFRPADQSVVLRIEWTSSVVDILWPATSAKSLTTVTSQSLRYSLVEASALATLMFILMSFVGLLFINDHLLSSTLLSCGLGCFLLLCILVFTDRDE